MPTVKNRIAYFDLLRLFASFSVVFMHTVSGSLYVGVADHVGWYLTTAATALAFTAVPLFFMMSGYLLTASERTASVSYLLKTRLPRLLVPLAFWSLLVLVCQVWQYHTFDTELFLRKLLFSLQKPANVSYWFLFALLGIYLISPVLCVGLRGLDRQGEIFVLALILILKLRSVAMTLFPDFAERCLQFQVLDYLEFFGSHLSAFVLGWFLGKSEKRIPFSVLIPTALLTYSVIVVGTFVRSAASGCLVETFLSQDRGFEVLLAACLFLIAKQAKLPKRLEKPLAALAPHTFTVYLTHCICLLLLQRRVEYTAASMLLLRSVVTYLIGLALSFLCIRIPVLSFLTTGQPQLRRRRGGE